MWRIFQLIIACTGTVVAIGLIITIILILIGRVALIKLFFYLHFTIGTVIIFVIFWPYYSKKMKFYIDD